jgi:hypothetical protein
MKLTRFLSLILLGVATLLLSASGDLPPVPASPETRAELSTAFYHRLQGVPAVHSLTFDLFTPELDTAFTSLDGKTAVMWIALRDDYGRILATEPGLVLGQLTDEGWQVILPGDTGWEETLNTLPYGMLPLELSPAPDHIALDANINTGPLTGYYLPYAMGTSRWLEGSISHFHSIPELGYPSCSEVYCRYAYDFTDVWHFPLLASKSGKVIASRDSCLDGNPGCTNYIVLYNAVDQAYQIYLHLAYGTIPDTLTSGTKVKRGQYLGDTDDTGYSTSQHVHFMVTDSIWMGNSGYYWGQSIDIRFEDVEINNGIPRTCYEITHFPIYDGATECLGDKSDPRDPANDWYVSGNLGAYSPTGALIEPAAGITVTLGSTTIIDVTASANDDVGVTAVRLVAKLNNQWIEIGPIITKPITPGMYEWDVDLCATTATNGSLELALRIWDYEGNIARVLDPRTIYVDHACPPPTSYLNPAGIFDSTAVHLSWEAATAGAGINSFELQWREEPGSWDASNIITASRDSRSRWFTGQAGGTYAFRLRALDSNGQPEPWPEGEAYETSATLPITCTVDAFEPDDELTQARTLNLGESGQSNLCEAGDPDWFQVEIENVDDYFVIASSQSGGAAVKITVYAPNGGTVLANGQAAGLGQDAIVRLNDVLAGKYFIEVYPLTPDLMGTDAIYGISVGEVKEIFLPLVMR